MEPDSSSFAFPESHWISEQPRQNESAQRRSPFASKAHGLAQALENSLPRANLGVPQHF
jgi:hypothetical protein